MSPDKFKTIMSSDGFMTLPRKDNRLLTEEGLYDVGDGLFTEAAEEGDEEITEDLSKPQK